MESLTIEQLFHVLARCISTRGMSMRVIPVMSLVIGALYVASPPLRAQETGTRQTETYRQIKEKLDLVPAIDTHDHLHPFERLPGFNETKQGKGMNLAGLWRNSYYTWYNPLTPWQKGMEFDEWWSKARSSGARSPDF